jgi:hypothetical protein
MTNSEMAVAIATDVISQLRKRNSKMKVKDGNAYVDTDFRPEDTTGDLREILPEMLKTDCTVCAKGALIISKARLFNKVPLKKIFPEREWQNFFGRHIDRLDLIRNCSTMSALLSPIFPRKTADLIEAAFEKTLYYASNSSPTSRKSVNFGLKYPDPKKRLIAIMKNVIANNGDFVP